MSSGARGTGAAAIACVLGALLSTYAHAQISQSESARAYAARLAEEIEKVTTERDAARETLARERKEMKAAIDRTVGKAVAREALLTDARRRIAALEAEQARLEAEQTRLQAEIEGLAESQRRAAQDHAKREGELIERARSADIDRSEAERLATEGLAETEKLRADLASLEETAREASSVHTQQLADLQTHILELERSLATQERTQLAHESRAPGGSEAGDPRRIAELERELEEKSLEAAELAKTTTQNQREIRALRSAREGLEKELETARSRPDWENVDLPLDGAVEEQEPGELRRLLALERERRSTLEGELVRLSATGDLAERYRESWQALQAAKADLLLLSEKLTQEQAKRQELEGLLERVRDVASAKDGDDAPLERLIDVANEHGRETKQLEAELEQANDQITRLRGYLETVETPDGGGAALVHLDEENEKLRVSLAAAENTIGRLSGKAALAERLADLVYHRDAPE